MPTIQIFDRALCCASGVCGPQVDPELVQFAADLEWLRAQGHRVVRFNLAQQPAEFAQHAAVTRLLKESGPTCLPLVFADGQLVSRDTYPTRQQLVRFLPESTNIVPAGSTPFSALQILDPGCAPGSGCC